MRENSFPLFFRIGEASRILDINLNEVRTLFSGGELTGLKTADGLRIDSESLALFIGKKELKKKSFLWQKGDKK